MLHQVGAGALGPVFRAFDAERERLVAVKVFRLDLPPDRMHQLVGEFERLIRAGGSHPGVVAPLATGTDGIVVYVVHPFIQADSLDVVMRDRGPASPGDALRVAAQLAGALDVAAALGVHHGALHPRDVLLAQDEARVTGLGVTRALEKVGVTPPVRRPYTAPERIAGGAWDRRADVFSLAALVHEMMWGRRVTGVGDEAAASLTVLPGGDLAALKGVFARALAPDPADRFETALDWYAALKDALPDVAAAPVRAAEPEDAAPADRRRVGEGRSDRHHLDSVDAADVIDRGAAQPLADGLAAPPDDYDLRAPEGDRSGTVDVAPAEAVLVPDAVPVREIPAPLAHARARPDASRVDMSRADAPPSRWPVAAALIIGLAGGFGGGYFVGGRQPSASAVASSSIPSSATPSSATPAPAAGPTVQAPVAPTVETTVAKEPLGADRRQAEAAAVVAPGRLVVRSTPDNAHVFVDGLERGRTPATIQDLAAGAHQVRITRDGYVDRDRRIVITAKQPAQSLTVTLARARTGTLTGTLNVESRPSGAKVLLDGKVVGTTPFSSAQVKAGEHALGLERSGYRRWSSSVRIVSGERKRVRASLER